MESMRLPGTPFLVCWQLIRNRNSGTENARQLREELSRKNMRRIGVVSDFGLSISVGGRFDISITSQVTLSGASEGAGGVNSVNCVDGLGSLDIASVLVEEGTHFRAKQDNSLLHVVIKMERSLPSQLLRYACSTSKAGRYLAVIYLGILVIIPTNDEGDL